MALNDFLGPAVEKAQNMVTEAISDIKSAFGGADKAGNSRFNDQGDLYVAAGGHRLISTKDLWTIAPDNWYKVFPYQFVVLKDGAEFAWYTLPIPPQALVTKMIPASQATATVGGVVEETSANVFWAINLMGTTGIAIGRNSGDKKKRQMVAEKFRERLETTGAFAGTFQNLGNITNKIGGTVQAGLNIASAAGSGSISGVMSGISGGIQNALLPSTPFAGSAVNKKTNGFSEIQEIHRFLLVYSRLKGAYPGTYSLEFRNWKTSQKWNCVVQDFTIQQNATNPHLYRYNIQLKCWDVWDVNEATGQEESGSDRFGPGGDLSSVNTLSGKKAIEGLQKVTAKLGKGGGFIGTLFK